MELNLEPVPENPQAKKRIAAILAFVAAAALLVCGVSRRWLAADHVDAGFGPRGWSCESGCTDEIAGAKSNAQLVDAVNEMRKQIAQMWGSNADLGPGPNGFFPIAGWLALAGIVIAAGGLIASGVLVLGKGLPTRPIAPTTIALLGLLLALIFGMVFVALNPLRTKGLSPVGVAWAFWLFAVAVVTGIVAAQKLAKFKKLEPGEIVL